MTDLDKLEPTPELDELLAQARTYWDSLSPEEQRAQLDAQAKAWVKAEMAFGDEGTRVVIAPQALARRDGVEERVNSGHGSVYDRLLTFIHDRDDALRGDEGTSPDEIDETVLAIMRITGSHPADPRPDPLEALREARDVWVVGASCGDYSDRREWSVSAHLSEQEAKDEVGRLTVLARELAARKPNTHDSTWVAACPIYQAYKAWQKEVEDTIGESDPEDTRFFAGPVPLAKINAVMGEAG
jgi:hypothetical protein